MQLKSKKGQTGGSAATLVAVIALLIVLYILFLPPDVREDLLDDTSNGDTSSTSSGKVIATLLTEKPGRLEELQNVEIEHNLPSVNLFSVTGSEIIKKAGSIYVKNGIFDKKEEKLSFGINDFENTQSVILAFSVKENKGRLVIRLNGEEIYNNEILTRNVMPIELPKEMLSETNMLEFSVSEVGAAFWRTNEFTLENVQISGDVTDTSSQESRNVFVLSATEKNNLEKAKLRFAPDCSPGETGMLEIYVNNHQVFSSVPDCGQIRPLEFSPDFLDAGENKLVFKTNKGRYLIDQISVTTQLKEITFPAYFFEIERKYFEDIMDNKADVNLTLRFIDNNEFKRGKIFVNGKTLALNTEKSTFTRNLDNFVEEGENGIRIEPDNTVLDIIELRINLVKH